MSLAGDRSELEELGNVVTHGIGAILAVVATIVLTVITVRGGDPFRIAACVTYGLSLISVFVTSTLYHSSRHPLWQLQFLKFDYTAIYLLIAGSYTPFALVPLRDTSGWWLFGAMWAMAGIGIALRWWGPRQWPMLSTVLYVVMGWGGVALAGPLVESFPASGLAWLVAGGVVYSVGAVFFLWERLPFNHLIWHFAVLTAASFHYVAVAVYVAPV